MAVAIVQTGAPQNTVYGSGTGVTSIALPLSGAPSSSNLVALFVVSDATGDGGNTSAQNSGTTISTPAGFTAGPTYNYTGVGGSFRIAIFYATGQTATSYTVSFNNGTYAAGFARELSGANNSSPTAASAFNATMWSGSMPQTLTGPSATPPSAGCLAVGGFFWNDDAFYSGSDLSANNQQSGWTEDVAPFDNTAGAGRYYPGTEAQYIAFPASGVAINPANIVEITNDNGIAADLAFLGYIWIVAPAASPLISSGPGAITIPQISLVGSTYGATTGQAISGASALSGVSLRTQLIALQFKPGLSSLIQQLLLPPGFTVIGQASEALPGETFVDFINLGVSLRTNPSIGFVSAGAAVSLEAVASFTEWTGVNPSMPIASHQEIATVGSNAPYQISMQPISVPKLNDAIVFFSGRNKAGGISIAPPQYSSLLNCVGWFDAADPSVVIQSSGSVSQWNDKSGHGNNVAQATGGQKPTLTTLNGLTELSFAAASTQFLQTTTASAMPLGSSGNSVFAVFTSTGQPSFPFLVGWGGPSTDYSIAFGDGASGGLGARYDGTANAYATATLDTNPHILSGIFSGGNIPSNYAQWLDGSSQALSSGISATAATSGTDLAIGALCGGSFTWQGSIGEVIILNGVATTAQRQLIEGYLAWKWGLQANLPAGHPYAGAAPLQTGAQLFAPMSAWSQLSPITNPLGISTKVTPESMTGFYVSYAGVSIAQPVATWAAGGGGSQNLLGGIVALTPAALVDMGASMSDEASIAVLTGFTIADTGAAMSDSAMLSHPVVVTDIGASMGDVVHFAISHKLSDIGASMSDHATFGRMISKPTDTGARMVDQPQVVIAPHTGVSVQIIQGDTGAQLTDTPVVTRPRSQPDDTGAHMTDFVEVIKQRHPFISAPAVAVTPTCRVCGSAVFCDGPFCPSISLPLPPDLVPMTHELFLSVPILNISSGTLGVAAG